jgi:Ras-related protein Rab-1A
MYDDLFKILKLGDSNSGKTSLLDRLVNNQFVDFYISTIGIDFNVKTIRLEDETKVKLQIWDSCGQERFRSLTRSYYRNSSAFIICYDVTNLKSFENAKFWISEIEKYVDDHNVYQILVGTKNDMQGLRQIEYSKGINYAHSLGIDFIETSSKNDINVKELFYHLSVELNKTKKIKDEKIRILEEMNNNARKKFFSCC